MKYFTQTANCLVIILLAAYINKANAQTVSNLVNAKVADVNDSVPQNLPPQSLYSAYKMDDTAIENRLVELALAQPSYQETVHQQKIFEYQLKRQRNSWMNLLTLSANYNDQTFARHDATSPSTYVYPKFFFGVNIPLGLIVSNGTDVRITKQSQLIAKAQQEELAKKIKAEVLTNYKQFRANEKLIAIQNQALDDEQANFLQVEQKFKMGTATLEAYNEASKRYNDEQVKIINLQLQQDLIKVQLEQLIGTRLEDVIK